jgi:protein O-mannosyl-transferase
MPPDRDPAYRAETLLALCLALVTLVLFWPSRDCRFTNYDDPFYVTGNPHVHEGLSRAGAWWALTATSQSNWHPLTWLSLQLDYELFRLYPYGYRVTNLLLHTANALSLFVVLRRLTGAVAPSTLTAALFAVHPLHVESVAWVAERKDVLSTLFWMLTLWAYVRYVERLGWGRYACVVLALAAGLMAKPMLVTLPCVLLLLDYWPLGRWAAGPAAWRRLLLEKLPLFALAAASCVVTLIAQARGGAIRALEELPLAGRAANAVVAYVTYLVQTFWPRDLAAFYPYEDLSWSDGRVWGACLFLAGVTAVAALQAGRRPYFLVGWLWYLGTLVPVIGLVQVGGQAHADRYTYVPLIGVFVMAAWTVADLARQGGWVRRVALAGTTAAALLGCLFLTWVQVGYRHDSMTLWTHAIAVTGPNAEAHYNLGVAHLEAGKLEPAAEEFRRTLAIDPRYRLARLNLARVLFTRGRLDEARDEFTQLVETYPDDFLAQFHLGLIASMRKESAEAIARYTQALRLRPEDARAHTNLALELTNQQDYEAARRHLREAERWDPGVRHTPGFQAAVRAAREGQARP